MKYILLVLCLLPLYVSAQVEKPILSKLLEYSKEKTPAYCGYSVAYGVLKFKLQESTENFKKGDIIFIIQKCPREIMEMSVGDYENNKIYNLFIGSEASEKFSEIGYAECEKFYPKDNPKKFWYGGIKNSQ